MMLKQKNCQKILEFIFFQHDIYETFKTLVSTLNSMYSDIFLFRKVLLLQIQITSELQLTLTSFVCLFVVVV